MKISELLSTGYGLVRCSISRVRWPLRWFKN